MRLRVSEAGREDAARDEERDRDDERRQPCGDRGREEKDHGDEKEEETDEAATTPELLIGFAPGLVPMTLPAGQAKLVKAGSDFVFQMHFTANGKAGSDRSRIDEAFWISGVLSRAGAGRSLHSDRSLLPDLESSRSGNADEVH